jgi:hypothetical protein
MKLATSIAGLCALALVVAGCGGDDDNDTLSYDDTGTEISAICESVNFGELTGKAEEDAPRLAEIIPDFEGAIQEVRDLEVNEELEADRDAFAQNADQQVAVLEEAQAIAETGNTKEYRKKLDETQSLGSESDALASRLGASGCGEE